MDGEWAKQYQHALVWGKFFPPHKGHVYMIQEAAKIAERVTVLVAANQYQSIPLGDRVEWIREALGRDYPNVDVQPFVDDLYDDYESKTVWLAHMSILQAKLRQLRIDENPLDVIVTSEEYGEEIAGFLGIDHYEVDIPRTHVPISGTQVRADVAGSWPMLPLATRRGIIPRVIVVGAESTGTTTLSLALAEHFDGRYVPEYGREFTIDALNALQSADEDATMDDITWFSKDFEKIGEFQTVLEDRAATRLEGFPLVVADTDAFATALWEARYTDAPWEETIFHPYAQYIPARDLYILTDHVGVPFVQDGIRDGEDIRPDMTTWFEDSLTVTGKSWVKLTGTHEERMAVAVPLVEQVLRNRLTFK